MDETANQMSDVRVQLINALGDMRAHVLAQRSNIELADAELGQMVAKVHGENSFYHVDIATKVGERLRNQLERAGLAIVRSGEAAR